MEYKALARALSVLLAIVALFMLLCMLAGLFLGEGTFALLAFAPAVALGLLFLLFVLFTRNHTTSLSARAGYLFVSLAWILSASLGALPYIFSGSMPSLADSFFEAMSGFTTTGATVVGNIEALPRSLLLWRATTHWLGGMGIVVLTVAIFPLLGINGRALMEAESPGPQVEKFTPRLSQTASILWFIYLAFTAVLVVLLLFGGMDIIDALSNAFSTMATGGFSNKNASIAGYNSAYIEIVITIFMVMAGISFSQYWRILRGDFRTAFLDSETRVYLIIFVVASLGITINIYQNNIFPSLAQSLRYACFQVASIFTTTGSATTDYLVWPAFSQAVLFILMLIGGCAGSTAGGIKVSRVLTLFKMALAEMKFLLNPRGIYGIFVNGRYMRKTIVYDIAAMVYLYIGFMLLSMLVLSAGGFDILTSLSATMACLGNIGPGFSLVGPSFNYGFFPSWVKFWLFFVMMAGRLEMYTVLILFTRSFWRRA